jgi:short-subunit dehydrogenase
MAQNERVRLSLCARLTLGGMALFAAARAARAFSRRQRAIDFNGKVVLISGASRGLGLELARGFAAEGADLVLLARDRNKLEDSATELKRFGVNVEMLGVDVGDRMQVRDAMNTLRSGRRAIDVLVNNAGTIQVGPLENMELEDYETAMRVHFWGPLYLMQELIPDMQKRSEGRIVNIASIGGKVAVPHLLPYAASKFALVGLSEGMRAELLRSGIYVTTVCPGLMRTGSHFNAYFKGQHRKEYALFAIANASPLLSTASSQAARQIIEACRYGDPELVITPQARLLRLVNSLFPNVVAESLALVGRLLPASPGHNGDTAKRGVDSRSPMAPSVLTHLSDRAAARNNEIPSFVDPQINRRPREPAANRVNSQLTCVCQHPTHFLGRCQAEVSTPEETCADCMENHFHRIDDPSI